MASDIPEMPEYGRGMTDAAPEKPAESNRPAEETVAGEVQAGAPPGPVDDAELLELLEQLSETIDSAQNALHEQHMISAGAVRDAASSVERGTDPAVAGAPLPAGGAVLKRPGRSGNVLAACVGVCLGLAVLAAMWVFRNAQEPGSGPETATGNAPAGETRIVRSSAADIPVRVPPERSPPPPADEPPAVEIQDPPPARPGGAISQDPPPDGREQAGPLAAKPSETAAYTADPALPPKPPQKAAGLLYDAGKGLPPLNRDDEARTLRRGRDLSAAGDIAGSRLTYEYAARRGSAEAMFALGQTYDPAVLASWGVIGIAGDTDAALGWYKRAAELGHEAADARTGGLDRAASR